MHCRLGWKELKELKDHGLFEEMKNSNNKFWDIFVTVNLNFWAILFAISFKVSKGWLGEIFVTAHELQNNALFDVDFKSVAKSFYNTVYILDFEVKELC